MFLVICCLLFSTACYGDNVTAVDQIWDEMAQIDSDGDGRISKDEFLSDITDVGFEFLADIKDEEFRSKITLVMYKSLDINNDNYIKKSEYMNMKNEKYRKIYTKYLNFIFYLDEDKNGIINIKKIERSNNKSNEYKELVKSLKTYDINGDGFVDVYDLQKRLKYI